MTKHTILFLAANPSGTDRLALDREAHAIHAELKRSGYRDRFVFETRWVAEPLDLLRELRELEPTVVHFGGHGGGDGLCFQAADGRARVVPPAALTAAFGAAGASVKLVDAGEQYADVSRTPVHGRASVRRPKATRTPTAQSTCDGCRRARSTRRCARDGWRGGCGDQRHLTQAKVDELTCPGISHLTSSQRVVEPRVRPARGQRSHEGRRGALQPERREHRAHDGGVHDDGNPATVAHVADLDQYVVGLDSVTFLV